MSGSFRDRSGRGWTVEITVGTLPRLRAVGLDLSAVVRNPEKMAVFDDPEIVGRVLWVLCGQQAAIAGVTEEAFADLFDGPTLFDAMDATLGAIADFFHRPEVAKAVKERLPVVAEAHGKAAIRAMDATISTLIASAGNSPGSSGSTPAS